MTNAMPTAILLISTDESIIRKMRTAAPRVDADLILAANLDDAAPSLDDATAALVVCNYPTFDALHRRWPKTCVLLYAEPADSEQAIEAMKRGALDFLVRPIAPSVLEHHLRQALRIAHDISVPAVYEARPPQRRVEPIVGQSVAMKEVYKLIGLIAPKDINVLITGESGTGKELVARAILHHSPRRDKPFLAVNCAAIPETLLESELFGHEKGAFTGADTRRIGKFEQCDGGTLFLDEVGDIPLATQAKLLRVLQDRSFQRLGGTSTVTTNVRIIAATHQPLERLIMQRRFREDLYYRLKVASIHVPALRDREIDVVILAHHFVNHYNREFNTRVRNFDPEVLPALLHYRWPGNVRELENTVKAALVVARGTTFRLDFLPEHIRRAADSTAAAGAAAHVSPAIPAAARDITSPYATDHAGHPTGGSARRSPLQTFAVDLVASPNHAGQLLRAATASVEREIILATLTRTNGKLAQAASLLGISRTTLRKKIADHGIHIATTVTTNGSPAGGPTTNDLAADPTSNRPLGPPSDGPADTP